MAACVGCGRKRGFFGVYTRQQCHRCDSYFCASLLRATRDRRVGAARASCRGHEMAWSAKLYLLSAGLERRPAARDQRGDLQPRMYVTN